MKVCKCVEDYTRQITLTDIGLLKLCACSAGVIMGLFIPKKKKTCVLATASLLFSLTLLPLMFKAIKTMVETMGDSQ